MGEHFFWTANFAIMAAIIVMAGVAVAYIVGAIP